MRKIKPQTAKFLFAPTVGLFMSETITFALTAINFGFSDWFVTNWLKSFAISFLVALPISAFLVPRIQKFYAGITENTADSKSTNNPIV